MASQVALVVKNLSANAGDVRDSGLIPGLGRSPRGGHGNPLQYSCLENLKDREAWRGAGGSSKKQENSRKTSISALLTMPKPLTVWITINWGKF